MERVPGVGESKTLGRCALKPEGALITRHPTTLLLSTTDLRIRAEL
jgi:hypothetical protein